MKLPAGFDFNTLEVFMLTAELGGMTQSAKHLGVTQSAVSQIIAKLEAGLGTSLFDRSLRPLTLTTSGAALFEMATRLLASATDIVSELRDGSQLAREHITIALSESLANFLTSPILDQLGPRAARWTIRSGISQDQHQQFLARKIDLLVTGSSRLEQSHEFEHHPIFRERFLLVLPAGHRGVPSPIKSVGDLPFIRYSLQSGMGQTIERQLARMKWLPPKFAEIDSTRQQLGAVAAGLGWSITTPLCVAGQMHLLPRLQLQPMEHAAFSRTVQVVARRCDLGDLPKAIAVLARQVLHDDTFGALLTAYPWIDGHLDRLEG